MFSLLLITALCQLPGLTTHFKKAFKKAEKQTGILVVETAKADKGDLDSPRTVHDGKLVLTKSPYWNSSFFPECFEPGCLGEKLFAMTTTTRLTYRIDKNI